MSTTTMNVRIEKETKRQAQEIAEEMGLSLSAVVNAYMHKFVREKRLDIELEPEIPNEYLRKAIKEAEEDLKAGRVSPAFDNAEDANKWLDS